MPGLPTGGEPRTFSLWYRTDWQSLAPWHQGYLFGYGAAPNGIGWFGLRALSFDWISLNLLYGQWIATAVPTADSRWHHLVLALERRNPTLYIDGIPMTWQSFPLLDMTVDTGISTLQLGSYGGEFFDGAIDDVRVYNRALSMAEAFQIFGSESVSTSDAPNLRTQPESQAVFAGESASFTVMAIGQEPLRYQWRYNGSAIASGTNPRLVIPVVGVSMAGAYEVVVTNGYGAVTSVVANLLVSLPPSGPPTVPTNGLVAYYPFSGNANDASGNGAHGTNYHAMLTTDRFGNSNAAYYFNATNLSGIVANVRGLPTGGEPRTFSLWYRTDWQTAAPSHTGYFFGYGATPSAAGWFGLRALSFDWISLNLLYGQWIATAVPTADSRWHHLALVFANGYPNLYIDGETRAWQSYPPLGTVVNSGEDSLHIGSYGSEYFDGILDEFRAYNRALSGQEIHALYQAEVPPPPVISTQPQSVVATEGTSNSITVGALGTEPLYYQWRKDGVNLTEGTTSTLSLTNIQRPRIGDYSVVVSNFYGCVTSSVASLSLEGVDSTLWRGLVAYYPFNSNPKDESGFGDDGVVQNAQLASDRFGKDNAAYDFVATNHATITAAGKNMPRGGDPRTLAFWFKARRLDPSIFTVEYPVAWGSVRYQGATFASRMTSDNGFGIVGNFSDMRTFSFSLLDQVWHFAAFSFSGGSNIFGFVDGKALLFGQQSTVASLWNTDAGALTIGSFLQTGWFDGQVDDVRIYNRGLSGAEAQRLYVEEVGDGPRITNAVSASVTVGQSARLSVSAVGGQPMLYRWYDRYDNVVPEATNDFLLIEYPCATNLGAYRAVVSNSSGMASAQVNLTVANPYSAIYMPLSRILPGSEKVDLLPNGDLETVSGTNASGQLTAANWDGWGSLTLATGTNTVLTDGKYVSVGYVSNNLSASVRYQSIQLEANTEYVLSGYVWNMGDPTNKVNTALDAADVVWDPQITLGPGNNHEDNGCFVYHKFHSGASGTNITIRAYYDGKVGMGAAAAYFPLAAQWDNIAVTRASEFVPPEWAPLHRTNVIGESLQMKTPLSGDPAFGYRWLKDGTPLPGMSNSFLTMGEVQLTGSGIYSVVTSNWFGVMTNGVTALVVRPPSPTPVLTGPLTNPANGHIYSLLGLTDHWLDAEYGARALGGHLLTIRSADEQHWIYDSFSQLPDSPGVWIGLVDQDPYNNSTELAQRRSEFSWIGGEALVYSRWQKDEPNNAGDGSLGEFYGHIFGTDDSPTSRGFWNDTSVGIAYWSPKLGVAEIIPLPSFTLQPQSRTVARGSLVVLSADVIGALPLSYQWRRSGVDIVGETNSTLTLNNIQSGDAGGYKLVVSNSVGVATSQGAVLTVLEPVLIGVQPSATTVNQGGSTSFTVGATGGGTLYYHWIRGGVEVVGGTTSTLTITNAQPEDDTTYSVMVSNIVSRVTSGSAHLLVVLPPQIASQPQARTNLAGTTASFTVVASGTSPAYQWRKGGVSLADGTGSSLLLLNVSSTNAGVYDVVVWNQAGTNISHPVTLTVLIPPSITLSPTNQSILVSNSATFTVTATGTDPLRYQWRRAGQRINGATLNTYVLPSVQTNDAGTYDVIVSNIVGNSTSRPFVLTVLYPPVILLQPTNTSATLDATASFSVVANGSPAPTYRWLMNGTNLLWATNRASQVFFCKMQ